MAIQGEGNLHDLAIPACAFEPIAAPGREPCAAGQSAYRSFDPSRRMRPVCARPVLLRVERGSFQPLISITRRMRLVLYCTSNSRLTSAVTRRAPYDSRVRITERICAVTVRSSALAYRSDLGALSRYALDRPIPSTRQIGAVLKRFPVITLTRRSSSVCFLLRPWPPEESPPPWSYDPRHAPAPECEAVLP